MQAEGLANDAAQAIALDRAAGGAHRHRQSQARRARLIECRSHREESVTDAPPARVGGVEIASCVAGEVAPAE